MLPKIYGTHSRASQMKKNYHLPRPLMLNSDLDRIINSQEVQSSLKPRVVRKKPEKKRNPLKDPDLYAKLNPLFEKQWKEEVAKDFREDAKVSTTRLLKPLKKRQRVKIEVSSEQKFSSPLPLFLRFYRPVAPEIAQNNGYFCLKCVEE